MVDFVPIVVSIQNHKPSQLIPLHRRNVGIVYTYIIYLHTSCGLYIRILFYYIFDVEFFKSSNNHIVCRNRYNILVLYIILYVVYGTIRYSTIHYIVSPKKENFHLSEDDLRREYMRVFKGIANGKF